MLFPQVFAQIFTPDAALMRKFVLLIPLIHILLQFMTDKTMAVYTAEPVADFLAVTFTVCLFAHQFKKALRQLDSRVE